MGEKKKNLTPYQGQHRTFGLYRCQGCNKTWASAYSWANTAQACLNCFKNVYPHTQKPLMRRGKQRSAGTPDKAHKEEQCGKCKEIGYSCTKLKLPKKKTL